MEELGIYLVFILMFLEIKCLLGYGKNNGFDRIWFVYYLLYWLFFFSCNNKFKLFLGL